MMFQAVLSNRDHPEYGVATIPFPIPHDQYTYCMDLLEALEIGDAVKADCKVEKIDSFYTVLKRTEMLTVNVEELNYLAKRLDSFDTGEAAQFQAMAHKLELFQLIVSAGADCTDYDEELQQVNMAKTRLMAQKAELEKEQRGAAAFESRLAELDMALEQASGTLTDFDELTVRQLVSNIKVLDKDSLLICFKDGTEITQAMQRRQTA